MHVCTMPLQQQGRWRDSERTSEEHKWAVDSELYSWGDVYEPWCCPMGWGSMIDSKYTHCGSKACLLGTASGQTDDTTDSYVWGATGRTHFPGKFWTLYWGWTRAKVYVTWTDSDPVSWEGPRWKVFLLETRPWWISNNWRRNTDFF